MKFSFNYQTLKFDVEKYKQQIDKYLAEMLAQGALLWLEAATSIVPVWSGASHGTFKKFANAIGHSFVVPRGIPWLEGPGYGEARSNAIIVSSNGTHTIEYSTSLWYLIYNEYNDAMANPKAAGVYWGLRTPTPYHFQEVAGAAFQQFAQTIVLPSAIDALIIKIGKI
jgi:hypothetical protein